MNYLAHALPFLDRPWFAAGACVPDWLSVADRRVRMRTRLAEPFVGDSDAILADVAGGVLQHLQDDAWFHETRAFMETCLRLTALTRDALAGDGGFRPSFLGHLLTEVLLDAALAAEDPRRLEAFYTALDAVEPAQIEQCVNRMAARPTDRLAYMIGEFRRHRILWDYLEDGRLRMRLNQVMRRVGLAPLPEGFATVLSDARRIVGARREELLEKARNHPCQGESQCVLD